MNTTSCCLRRAPSRQHVTAVTKAIRIRVIAIGTFTQARFSLLRSRRRCGLVCWLGCVLLLRLRCLLLVSRLAVRRLRCVFLVLTLRSVLLSWFIGCLVCRLRCVLLVQPDTVINTTRLRGLRWESTYLLRSRLKGPSSFLARARSVISHCRRCVSLLS